METSLLDPSILLFLSGVVDFFAKFCQPPIFFIMTLEIQFASFLVPLFTSSSFLVYSLSLVAYMFQKIPGEKKKDVKKAKFLRFACLKTSFFLSSYLIV